MGCRTFGVSTIMVGLQRLGLVGLRQALDRAASAGAQDREAVVDRLIATLAAENYLPAADDPDLRRALWREYLRHRGEDFREFLPEVEVTVRGEPGPVRERLVAALHEVLAGLELRPALALEPPAPEGRSPQVAIGGETILEGFPSREALQAAVRRSITDW